jgi:hypothetical protein
MRDGRNLEALHDLIVPGDTCAMEGATLSLYQTFQHEKSIKNVVTHLAINEE